MALDRCQPFITGMSFLDGVTKEREGLRPGDVVELTGASGETETHLCDDSDHHEMMKVCACYLCAWNGCNI